MFARANGNLFVLVRHELAHLSRLGAVRVGGGAQNHVFWELEFPPQIRLKALDTAVATH
eukprot:SAG11_NODE_18272_length_495_cov_2.782828_1_plen_59_part_00